MNNKYLALLLPLFGVIGLLVYKLLHKQVNFDPTNKNDMSTKISKMSDAGKEFIKKWEGKRLNSYDDGSGTWTIGFGHTNGVKQGQSITDNQANLYFDEDIKIFEDFVSKLELDFTQQQFDAVCSLVYNIGEGQFLSSTLYKVLKENLTNYERISAAWSLWIYAGGVILQGLKNRRLDEVKFYFS